MSVVKESISKSPSGRVKRTSNVVRNRLTVNGKEDGYVYRVVNDTEDRIQQFVELGYEIVKDKDVTVGDKRVDKATSEGSLKQLSVGGGQKAFVMRIPKDWYDEDQATKQAYVDSSEAATKEKALNGTYGKLEINRD